MNLRLGLILLLLLLVAVVVMPAQAQEDVCPAEILERALVELGTNCANLGRNNACYGFNDVQADFVGAVPSGFFSQPSDRADLNVLQSIRTAPLDKAEGTWGIATLNVQANLPGALPGQNVVFMLLGAVEIEDAVPPEDALILPDDPLEVMTADVAQLRSEPDPKAPIASTVLAGTPLWADGVSADSQWLRVFFMAGREATAWVHVASLDSPPALTDLPVITPESRTPMQAFHFQTGLGGVQCDEAPSLLLVQGPENIAVNITANGADIEIGSFIVLRTLGDDTMQIIVLSGGAKLNPHSTRPIYAPPGFTSLCPLNSILRGNCSWTTPRVMFKTEQVLLLIINRIFQRAANLFHYIVHVPEVVCASGIGGVVCELEFPEPDLALSRAREQCGAGQLSPDICRVLFPSETS
ncbi:MAG: hypothetical protein K8J31_24290 [Anaerolineae bacterium]|nr:hypothetical protein [Anaerolineae bacterium]